MREHNDRRDRKGKITEPTREAKVQVCQAYLPKIGNCNWTTEIATAGGHYQIVPQPCFI